MALISLRQLLDHAAENNYGVPAFNVNNLEQMRAIMMAADETNSPVIVQASAGARKYAGAPFLRHLILSAIEEWPHIPVVMLKKTCPKSARAKRWWKWNIAACATPICTWPPAITANNPAARSATRASAL